MKRTVKGSLIIGWREWVALPDLHVPAIKTKVDTGTRTSILHATKIETFHADGRLQARFVIHPIAKDNNIKIKCVADVVKQRVIEGKKGQKEKQVVIRTTLQLGKLTRPVDITLINQKGGRFRLSLGRNALSKNILVNPSESYLQGTHLKNTYESIYSKSKL